MAPNPTVAADTTAHCEVVNQSPASNLKGVSVVSAAPPAFPFVLSTGGDDRTIIKPETQRTKYNTAIEPLNDYLLRSSCTGSPPTASAYKSTETVYKQILDNTKPFPEVVSEIRARLSDLYELPAGTGIFLAPSGTDAEFVPFLVAQALNPGKTIVNVVTCNSEVGSGTAPAAEGKFFSELSPLGGKVEKGTKIEGVADIELITVPARGKDGQPVSSQEKVKSVIDECAAAGKVPVVHAVIGSKTGLREPLLGRVDGAVGVIDACQGRFDPKDLHASLADGNIVLVTGSKFYQAPPFCGGIIVPQAIMARLETEASATGMKLPAGLSAFFTQYEIPDTLPTWRSQLPDSFNYGLAMRWWCGLDGMDKVMSVPEDKKVATISTWRAHVVETIKATNGLLSVFDEGVTESIVSLSFQMPSGLKPSQEDLNKICKWMTLDMTEHLKDGDAEEKKAAGYRCMIGQAVNVQSGAIVRIALGADSLYRCIHEQEATYEEDRKIVHKMCVLAKHFESLKDLKL